MTTESARSRLVAFFDELGRIDREDLQRIALPPAGEARREARNRAIDAAIVAGRKDLINEAEREVRGRIVDEYSAAGYRPTWLGLNWAVSTGRPEDRVALAEAVEDAAVAAIAADLIAADDVAELTWPYERLAGQSTGGPPPESLAFALRSRPGQLAALGFIVLLVAEYAALLTTGIGGAGVLAAVVTGIALVMVVRRRAQTSATPQKRRQP